LDSRWKGLNRLLPNQLNCGWKGRTRFGKV